MSGQHGSRTNWDAYTADYNAEGALCWYDLYMNAANPLHARLKQGIDEVKANGDLQGKASQPLLFMDAAMHSYR